MGPGVPTATAPGEADPLPAGVACEEGSAGRPWGRLADGQGHRAAEVPVVPRLGRVAGDGGLPLRIALDEAEPPGVVHHPSPGGRRVPARVDIGLTERLEIDRRSHLVLRMPGPRRL